jgi:hypothetical protein
MYLLNNGMIFETVKYTDIQQEGIPQTAAGLTANFLLMRF